MKFIGLFIFLFSLSASAVDIDIDPDKDDCVDGWISMDIEVTVDGEEFDFDPSCSFSFSKSFTTKSGVKCEVEAGMCSNFSPKNKFEIECSDGSDEEIDILCPADK